MPRRNEPNQRTCIVTRETQPIAGLIRFVVAPDGSVVADLRRRLPGRGAWVTASAEHVTTAERKRVFARGFGAAVTVEPGLADRVDALIAAAAISALSLARKAGALVGGLAKVETALAHDTVIGLIHAREAADGGVARLAAAARRHGRAGMPVVRCFAGEQLDLAFGRTNVIHAALVAGPASDNALARIQDLVRYRGDGADSGGAGVLTSALNDLNEASVGP